MRCGPSSKKSPFDQRVSAKTHGTKYHNPPPETNWREAITEDGNVYYWNTISHGKILLYLCTFVHPNHKISR